MEIRFLGSQEKLWILGLMYEDYDQILEKLSAQHGENTFIHKENMNKLISAIDVFLSSQRIPKKRCNTKTLSNLLASYHTDNLMKNQSVRFMNNSLNSEIKDQMPPTFG